jgi:hypothetical protein
MRAGRLFPAVSLLVIAKLVTGAAGLEAQAALRGIVRQDSTGRPLAGVEVLLEGTERLVTTNAAGRFELGALPRGYRIALFRAVGFRPVRLAVNLVEGDTVWTEATLVPASAQELEPLEVTAEAKRPRGLGVEAFEERRRMGFGKFIDSARMRRSEHRRVEQLVHEIPGVAIDWSRHWAYSTRRQGPLACWMQVVYDGVVIYGSGDRHRNPPDLKRDFLVSELTAIEVYRSPAETPIEFGGPGAGCGTIVLWSRRGP